MKGFKFKLDGLLKVREFKEKKLKIELGEILKEITSTEDYVKTLVSNIEETYKAQEEFLSSPTAGEMIKFFPRFIEIKKEEIKNKKNLIYSLQKKFDQKQTELGVARGEVKVIENLKEKKTTEYKKKLDKKHLESVEELNQIRRLLKESQS
ncbi:flagellar export protein FliJ [Halobacteriovorax marinus]|uniref:Flagellar FliJ protein n=1 Tax=Halobacteriovorax marinus TaxID=97084 RepID=A0A1Y5F5N4_9BACT|nr:flagellar export protein FliJ [Halobacteriovorax marinus]